MDRRRRAATFFVPLAAGLIAALLCLSGPADRAGLRVYDVLLSLRRPAEMPRDIVLIEADEATGRGEWDGLGLPEGIAALAELGPSHLVLPVPGFLDAAGEAGEGGGLAASVERELGQIGENVSALFDAIRQGSVGPRESPRYVAQVLQSIEDAGGRLREEARWSGRGSRIAGALGLVGRAYLAVDPLSDEKLAVRGLSLAVKSAGYAPQMIDPDGKRRRLALVSGRGATGYEHPAFAALLDRMGGPALAIGADSIAIAPASPAAPQKDEAASPGRAAARGLVLPLSRGGLLLPAIAPNAPRRVAWGELARAAALERELAAAFELMGREGMLGAEGGPLPGMADYAGQVGEDALAGCASLAEWKEARSRYFELGARFLAGEAERELLAQAADGAGGDAARLRAEAIASAFAGARQCAAELSRSRERLSGALAGSFCIVAPSRASAAAGTVGGGGMTEGRAAALAVGSIVSGRFLRELPLPLGAAFGAILALATAIASAWLGPRWALVEGLASALVGSGACAALFLAWGAYISPVASLLCPLAAAAAALALRRGAAASLATSQEAGTAAREPSSGP